MARKQTRRTFSVACPVYEATKLLAASEGITAAELVERALIQYGVPAPIGLHLPVAIVERAKRGRIVSGRRIVARVTRVTQSYRLKPGPIRRALGDEIADRLGEPWWKERVQ